MIYRSVLKNGYSNFSLNILEYCSPEKAIEREQYYLDFLKPGYNILKKAGSSLGRKHSDEAKEKMKLKALTPERLVSWPLTRQGSGSETALWARTIQTSSCKSEGSS